MIDSVFELTLWLIAAMALPGQAKLLLYGLAGVMALMGTPFRALQMLMVQLLLAHFNPTLTGYGGSGGIHLLVPVLVLLKMLFVSEYRSAFVAERPLMLVLACAPVFIAFQWSSSTYPILSVSKAVLFFIYVPLSVFLCKWSFRTMRSRVVQWYLGAVVFLIGTNLALLPTPNGYFLNGSGFNGILLHPNALGAFLGIGLAYLLAQLLATRRINGWFAAVGCAGVVELYLTQSRGGLFSCLFALAIYCFVKLSQGSTISQRILPRVGMVLLAVVALILTNPSAFLERVQSFVGKAQIDETNSKDIFQSARGAAMDLHMDLFREKPWTGHGFQVVNAWTEKGFAVKANDPCGGLIDEAVIKYDPITGKIPISAPVESGFMYTSILAENGIIGGALAYGVLLAILLPILLGPKHPEFVLLIAVLFSNMGEAVLFSPSGIGGWCWLMVGLAYASATSPRDRQVPALRKARSGRHAITKQKAAGVEAARVNFI